MHLDDSTTLPMLNQEPQCTPPCVITRATGTICLCLEGHLMALSDKTLSRVTDALDLELQIDKLEMMLQLQLGRDVGCNG